jgi:hypothetical protein
MHRPKLTLPVMRRFLERSTAYALAIFSALCLCFQLRSYYAVEMLLHSSHAHLVELVAYRGELFWVEGPPEGPPFFICRIQLDPGSTRDFGANMGNSAYDMVTNARSLPLQIRYGKPSNLFAPFYHGWTVGIPFWLLATCAGALSVYLFWHSHAGDKGKRRLPLCSTCSYDLRAHLAAPSIHNPKPAASNPKNPPTPLAASPLRPIAASDPVPPLPARCPECGTPIPHPS